MVQKRPLGEELYEVSSKQPRHLEPNYKCVSVLKFPAENAAPEPRTLGEGGAGCTQSKPESDEKLYGGNLAEFQNCHEKEIESNLPGSNSNSSWATSTISEEDVRLEAPPFCILLSPNHCDLEVPARTIVHTGDIYSSLLKHPPSKLVPIGSDFQAEIPEWVGHGGENLSKSSSGDTSEALNLSSELCISTHLADECKFAGSCLIPMPESPKSSYTVEKLEGGRIVCSCDEVGSVRCVRQHIGEAREKLRKTLGHEIFMKLGFCDMGEVVAAKWSEDEEEIFQEVVFTNPASLGRNFWNHLAIEFPARTKKEIVSYYFNVFMLRRRAEQNRVDVLDIDSDNDEWEPANAYAHEVRNRYHDSVVQSPAREDDFGHNEIYEDSMCEYNEDITQETLEANTHPNLDGNYCISNVSEMCPNEVLENHSFDPADQPLDQGLSDELGNHDFEDGRSTSDDTGIATDVAMEKAHNIKNWPSNFSNMSTSGHEFLLEPCCSKEWDVGYLSCSKDEDFLPTCSVIEEVFGTGAWNHQTRDG